MIRIQLSIPQIFGLALIAGTISALYAALQSRDLNTDSALYLLGAVRAQGLAFFEPARKSVQFLQQSFSFIGFQSGVTDLVTLGQLQTLGMQGWPLLLTGLCWFLLPPAQKGWIVGPLLNIAVIVPTTNFAGIGEGVIASCVMWLLFFLLEFNPARWSGLFAAAALTLAGFYLHEAAFPFMLGIAVLAALRARAAHGAKRIFLVLIALLAITAACNLVYLTLHRPGASYGPALLRGLPFIGGLLGEFLVTFQPRAMGIHLPAVAAITVLTCLLAVHFPRRDTAEQRAHRLRALARAALVFFAFVGLVFLAAPAWVITWPSAFAARGWPIIAATALTITIHLLRRAGWTPDQLTPPPIRLVLLAIIPVQFIIQTAMTRQWASYQRDVAALVASREGIIAWRDASDHLDPNQEYFRGALIWHWSIEPLSIVLAPAGRVRAVIDARPEVRWKPFRPDDLTKLPLCARGLDWSRYLATLGHADIDPNTRCP